MLRVSSQNSVTWKKVYRYDTSGRPIAKCLYSYITTTSGRCCEWIVEREEIVDRNGHPTLTCGIFVVCRPITVVEPQVVAGIQRRRQSPQIVPLTSGWFSSGAA